MAFTKRTLKYRHVVGKALKRDECYDNIRITKSPHDSNMCAVNGKFVAVVLEAQGGGSFVVFPLAKVGRFDINFPKVAGHKASVLDLAWNPFNDNEMASASEDCTIKLWEIPDEGISENLTTYTQDLVGHGKKVGQILWHPSAESVLVSSAYDNKIIVWNTKTAERLLELTCFPETIYSMSWSYNGSLLAVTCKDKKLRVIDVRSKEVMSEGKCHEGNKPSRVTFCGPSNKLFTTGFTRMSDRQYALWDSSDLSKPVKIENIDTGSGVQFPFYDEGTNMVYLVGKGDTTIRYFEITDQTPFVSFLSMYTSTIPQRGAGFMPKKCLDYMQCEVARIYKLQHTKGMIEPIVMTVPRKSEMFQEDVYPPCEAGIAAMTAEEWMQGLNKDPRLFSFSAEGLKPASASEEQKSKTFTVVKTEAPRKEEANVLKRLRSTSTTPDEEARPLPVSLDEYRSAYKDLLAENEKLRREVKQLKGQ